VPVAVATELAEAEAEEEEVGATGEAVVAPVSPDDEGSMDRRTWIGTAAVPTATTSHR